MNYPGLRVKKGEVLRLTEPVGSITAGLYEVAEDNSYNYTFNVWSSVKLVGVDTGIWTHKVPSIKKVYVSEEPYQDRFQTANKTVVECRHWLEVNYGIIPGLLHDTDTLLGMMQKIASYYEEIIAKLGDTNNG